jgi:hypothetical protein
MILLPVLVAVLAVIALVAYRAGVVRTCHHADYSQHLDLTGKDVISLASASREKAKALFPMLRDTSGMSRRFGFRPAVRAYNGEIGDEVHIFSNVRQGTGRVTRLLLKEGRVIEVTFQL